MAQIGGTTFHLKNFQARPSEAPGDKLIKIFRLTWASTQDIDLTGLVRKGSKVSYGLFEVRTVSASTGRITIAVATQAPAAADEVDVWVTFDASDLAPASEYVFS
jgi:hypothetical protein